VTSAVVVSLTPAIRLTRANLLRAAKGESALIGRGSRLRKGLVVLQIGACVLFLVSAMGLIDVSTRMVNANTGLSYEHVSDVYLAPHLRAKVAERLLSDPAVERVAAAWRAPLSGPMSPIGVLASRTGIEQTAGFMVVSPDYFPLFGIAIVRGRAFTALEADEGAAVALVSEATAHVLWPDLDPIDQTLDLVPARARVSARRPAHASVRVIGVTADVVSGTFLVDGVDKTCVYFATSLRSSDELSTLVRGRADMAALKASVTAAVNAIEPDAPFQFMPMRTFLAGLAWILQAFSAAASFLSVIGLLLAFSGTYAVVAFLVMLRTREFGIRIALGATAGQIVSGILGETLQTAAGIGVGLVMAAGLAQVFRGTIPIIPKVSVLPYLVGTGVVVIATVAAALIPSLRTTRIDPSRALRVD
jgi:putative ABC transport system permease protein